MDEVELFTIGVIFAVALATTEWRIREGAVRSLLDLSVLAAVGAVLYLLRLNLMHDATDFLSADAGVILVVGACGIGGLLPPTLLDG